MGTRKSLPSHALLGLAMLAPVAGCNLAQGLSDVGSALGNPDAALLDSPGRQLASGSFRRLLVDGSLSDGGHVIALRSDRDEQDVAVFPYPEGQGCFISPGLGVERLSSKVDVELDGVIAVQSESSDGRGEVLLVDFDCNEVLDSLPGAALPQTKFPRRNSRGVLALTDEGDLYLIDLRRRQLELIGGEVSIARTAGDSLWTIEGGALVGRDSELEEFARIGEGVREFSIPGGAQTTAAYADQNGIFIWSEDDGPQLISETGCGLFSWDTETVIYLDPCEDAQLNVFTAGSRIGVDDEHVRIVGPPGVTLPDRARTFWGQGNRDTELIFLIDSADDPGERLVLGRLGEEPKKRKGVYELELEVLSETGFIRGGQLYTDWQGGSGTLVEQERDDDNNTTGLKTIAESVVQIPGSVPFSAAGILTDYDGTVGTFRLMERDGDDIRQKVLAEKVPSQGYTVEDETLNRVFIGESEDGVTGTLYLYEAKNATVDRAPIKAIAENVYAETARFLEQPRGVAYLERVPDENYGILRVWLFDSEITVTVHEVVSEYRTVPWPAPGILYAVPEGEDEGLWFSKAR